MPLLESAARTASGTSDTVKLDPGIKALFFLLDVTALATDAGDTLNVYIQESPDGGTTWNDIISFAQCLGAGSAANQLAIINTNGGTEGGLTWYDLVGSTAQLGATKDGSLPAGNVRQGPVAPYLRAKIRALRSV